MALIAIFVSITALGWYGFHTYDHRAGGQRSLVDELYAAMQLFGLNFQAALPTVEVPPSLQIARFLAPAVTASAIIGAFAAIFRDRVTEKRVQWLSRDHVVVCGLGRIGALLARRLRQAGHTVVAIEENPTNESISDCREKGVIVLDGSATDRALLRKAIKRARYLFAVAGDDETNLRVATEAREIAGVRTASLLTCFVHLVDAQLAQLLFQAEIGASQSDLIRLEYFNIAELGAPAMLAASGLFGKEHADGESKQLVLVGCGEMGSRLLLHAARRWMKVTVGKATRLKVSVVDVAASQITKTIFDRYPDLDRIFDVVPWDMRVEDSAFDSAPFLEDPLAVFVCLPSDAGGLSAAVRVRHRLSNVEVPIVVRTTQQAGLRNLLSLANQAHTYQNVRVFSLMDEVCEPDTLLRGKGEILARAIHDGYLQQQLKAGKKLGSEPASLPWEELPDELKESNRRQADDIGRKLEAVACYIEPFVLSDSVPIEFSPGEIELLAMMEHERWHQEKKAVGYRSAPIKDEEKKETPFLLPWERLTDDVKEIDRSTIRSLPTVLSEIGFRIVRQGESRSSVH